MKASATLTHGILMSVGAVEIVIVLAIALLVFGPERLPQMGRTLGRAMREFRKASGDITGAFSFADDDEDEKQPREDAGTAASPLDPTAALPPGPTAAAPPEPGAATDIEADTAAREPEPPAADGPGAA